MAKVSPERAATKNNKLILIPYKDKSDVRITPSDQSPPFNNCFLLQFQQHSGKQPPVHDMDFSKKYFFFF
jgi:hypothetical protein